MVWRIQCIYSYAKWQKIKYAGNEAVSYFPDQEISWAVKYFFDALYYRELVEFEHKAHTFMDYIDSSDSKYKIVFEEMLKQQENGKKLKILDVGCGKGRYLKKCIIQIRRIYTMG